MQIFKQSSKYSTLLSITLSYLSGERPIPSRKNVSLDEMRWLGHRQRRTFCEITAWQRQATHCFIVVMSLAWDMLQQPAYSLNVIPFDRYLFRSTPPIQGANSLPIRINTKIKEVTLIYYSRTAPFSKSLNRTIHLVSII